ncbi:MAG TPA: DUF3618 domain-containing protein [Nocardioides sp.]|nr:DUF3618 domain-containing protein [Nocardioides sp.]
MGDPNLELAAIEAEIQRTRDDLEHTVDQLVAKAKPARSTVVGAAAVAVAAVVAIVVLKRRRGHR